MRLFTSFDGRISRRSFWLGMLGMIVISFGFIFLLGSLFATTGTIPQYAPIIISLLLLYPAAAISVKRLHDRNKAAMPWLVIFFAPGFVSNIMQSFKIDYTVMKMSEMTNSGGMMGMLNMGSDEVLIPGTIAMTVGAISMVVGIWALIELGFLKGSNGENSYGMNPLG